jgi:hypothetical protein
MRSSRWFGLLLALLLFSTYLPAQNEPTNAEILSVLETVSTELSRASEKSEIVSEELRNTQTAQNLISAVLSEVRTTQLPGLQALMQDLEISFNDYVTRTTERLKALAVVAGAGVVFGIIGLVAAILP